MSAAESRVGLAAGAVADAEIRAEAREWFRVNWDPDLAVGEWWQKLAAAGWSQPRWPAEWYGRGLSSAEAAVVEQERVAAGALPGPSGIGVTLAGPTILAHGSDEQKRRYLPPILSGTTAWCQLFSEPGAGSDLASVQCRALRDGDGYVVSGQKVWTSYGHLADYGLLMTRTDPTVPKHRGISYFAFPMDQPGAIEVRPLREATGRALFNEVFIDGARVDAGAMIDEPGAGWRVAQTTLAHEREVVGAQSGAAGLLPGRKAGCLEKRAGDYVQRRRPSGTALALGGSTSPTLIELLKSRGTRADVELRRDLATLFCHERIQWVTMRRAKAAQQAGEPGPHASAMKLQGTRTSALARELAARVLEDDVVSEGPEAPLGGALSEFILFSLAGSIYGGSDEIQRNIIGERVLGLPRDPSSDHDVAFQDVRVTGAPVERR